MKHLVCSIFCLSALVSPHSMGSIKEKAMQALVVKPTNKPSDTSAPQVEGLIQIPKERSTAQLKNLWGANLGFESHQMTGSQAAGSLSSVDFSQLPRLWMLNADIYYSAPIAPLISLRFGTQDFKTQLGSQSIDSRLSAFSLAIGGRVENSLGGVWSAPTQITLNHTLIQGQFAGVTEPFSTTSRALNLAQEVRYQIDKKWSLATGLTLSTPLEKKEVTLGSLSYYLSGGVLW